MATKKYTKKDVKKAYKRGKKVVKKAKKHPILTAFIVILLIAIVGACGFVYYSGAKAYNNFKASIDEYLVNYQLPETTDKNIDLSSEGMNVVWKSSNEAYISNTGIVTQPTYLEGDKKVTLTATFSFKANGLIEELYSKFFGTSDITNEFIVTVVALKASATDYVNEVINNINLPESTYDDLNFIDSCINEYITLTWQTDNICLDNNGIVSRPSVDTLVKVKLEVSYQSEAEGIYSQTKDFEVTVLANPQVIEEVDDTFNDLDESSQYKAINQGVITYYNAKVLKDPTFDESAVDPTETNSSDNYLRLRSKTDDMAYFESVLIEKAKELSFEYKYDGTQKTEGTQFDFYINNGNGYELVSSTLVPHSEEFKKLTYDLSAFSNFKIKVVYQSSFAENFVLIEDLSIIRDVNENDLVNGISVPSNIKKSIILPFTTKYGGSVTWTSSDENLLTSKGILVETLEESKKVNLTCVIKYLDLEVTQTYEITIKGSVVSDPIEIHFIDLGQIGLSDCGESIYIKYNDIDILVDAGDQFESTNYAVSKEINEYSNDKVLDYVIATHPDSDHIGNMAAVFEEFEVKTLIKFNGGHTTKKYENMKKAYEAEEGCEVIDIYDDIINGDMSEFLYLTSEIYIEFIDTGYYLNEESNGKSIVFVLTVYETRILFTGDADSQSAHPDLEEKYMDEVGNIDILKVVHHGTAQGTDVDFLSAVDPEVAIICNGNYLGNKHGHPHPKAINSLITYDSEMKIYAITGGGLNCEETNSGAYKGSTSLEESLVDRNGTIILTIDNNGYSLTSKLQGDALIDLRDTTYYQSYLNR